MRVLPMLSLAAFFAAGLVGLACGSSDSSPPTATPSDAGSDIGETSVATDAPGTNALFPAFTPTDPPQVATLGGAVMATPKIVPVFFAGDDPTVVAAMTDFTKKVGQTDYWKAAAMEYGVGPATGGDPIQLTAPDNPPSTIDDSAIQAWLVAKLNADDPAFGTPDANTIYTLFYPQGVTVTLGGVQSTGDAGAEGGTDAATPPGAQASCTSFGGYHQNVVLDAAHGGKTIAYAVVPRCPNFGGLTGIDVLSGAGSHELLEAATDPFPLAKPAFVQVDDAHIYWETLLGGGEIGDMCAQFAGSFVKFPELPAYTVQRTWSNKAITAGQDPCVPVPAGQVYFNSLPVLNDTVPFSVQGQTINVKGVHIAAGQSATVELDLYSIAPTSGPWTVSAKDGNELRGQAAQLTFAFDKTTGQNGDKIQMTITVATANKRNRETFAVLSKLGGQTSMWVGLVGN